MYVSYERFSCYSSLMHLHPAAVSSLARRHIRYSASPPTLCRDRSTITILQTHAACLIVAVSLYEIIFVRRQSVISLKSRQSNRFEISPLYTVEWVAVRGRGFISQVQQVASRVQRRAPKRKLVTVNVCVCVCVSVSSQVDTYDYFTTLAGLTHCSTCVIHTV